MTRLLPRALLLLSAHVVTGCVTVNAQVQVQRRVLDEEVRRTGRVLGTPEVAVGLAEHGLILRASQKPICALQREQRLSRTQMTTRTAASSMPLWWSFGGAALLGVPGVYLLTTAGGCVGTPKPIYAAGGSMAGMAGA